MNLRTNNPLNSKKAVHYKLYKSGKLWLVAGVTFCSFIGSAIINDQIAHADTVTVAKTATTVTRTTVSADSKTSNDSTQAATVSTTANKTAKTTSNIAHQPNSATNSLNTSQAATANSSTLAKTVSSATNQTVQNVSSSNNNSHEAKAHTTSAAAGSINQVSNTAVKSAARTENTNKATLVVSRAVNRQATPVSLMDTSSATMKIKPITYKIQSKQMTRNQYRWQGNNLYYYGNDGQPITGLRHYGHNKLEYYGTNHVQYRNRYASHGNRLYYFGSNGDAVTGLRHYGHNKLEYYGTNHVQYRNRYANVGNTRYYFGSNGDAVSTNRPQTEADIIGSMRVAQKAQQIVTVVQDGKSTATLKLWQKQGDTWRNILISSSRIGNGGIGNSHEGSSTTPKGVYHLSFAFGKGTTARTAGMHYRQIKSTSYWIEDQNDRQYNTWQDRSWANNKNEHLIDYTKAAPHNQYELAVVMDNQGQNNGSGFFIHVKNQWPTEGCVSISLRDMHTLVSHLGTKAYVVDVQSQAQLKNY